MSDISKYYEEDFLEKLSDKERVVFLIYAQEYLRRSFEETKNPLHVWESIKYSRSDDQLEDWVMDYLKKCADNLLVISRDSIFQEKGKEIPSLIQEALMMKKTKGNFFKDFQPYDYFVACAIHYLIQQKNKPKFAYDYVSQISHGKSISENVPYIFAIKKRKMSPATCRSIYKNYLQKLIELY